MRYALPAMREVLEPTYGVIVYQEQVMRIANVLAGYSLAQADVLRKAVGKKNAELIKKELGNFVEQAVAMGHPKKVIDDIAGQIETFGRYGFNKSHSVAYSILSYQTAWLKTHYPAEFMAALLSCAIGDTRTVVKYIGACRDMDLECWRPTSTSRAGHFTVIGERRIRFGLGAIRNVGRTAVTRSSAPGPGRPSARSRPRLAHRPAGLQQARGGGVGRQRCLRCPGRPPGQLFAAIDRAVAEAGLHQGRDRRGPGHAVRSADTSLPPPAPRLPEVPEWSEQERLAREKELVGFFVSGHPLGRFAPEVALFATHTTADLGQWTDGPIQVAAVITAVKRQIARRTGAEWPRSPSRLPRIGRSSGLSGGMEETRPGAGARRRRPGDRAATPSAIAARRMLPSSSRTPSPWRHSAPPGASACRCTGGRGGPPSARRPAGRRGGLPCPPGTRPVLIEWRDDMVAARRGSARATCRSPWTMSSSLR